MTDAIQKLKDDDLIESNGMATLGGLDRKGPLSKWYKLRVEWQEKPLLLLLFSLFFFSVLPLPASTVHLHYIPPHLTLLETGLCFPEWLCELLSGLRKQRKELLLLQAGGSTCCGKGILAGGKGIYTFQGDTWLETAGEVQTQTGRRGWIGS